MPSQRKFILCLRVKKASHISLVEYKAMYQYEDACILVNILKFRGLGKGERVCIYMRITPEATYAMLALLPGAQDLKAG